MMDDQSRNHLEHVVDLLIAGKLYLLAGAGLSCRAGIPGWIDLLSDFASEYEKRPYHSETRAVEIRKFATKRDLELFELMKNDEQGNIALIDVLKRHFCNRKCDVIHNELLNLPFQAVVTTNYDTCFESACIKYGICPEFVEKRWFCFPEYDGRTISMGEMLNGERFMLHMHGCFWHGGRFEVENIILAPTQYLKFYRRDEMDRILTTLKDAYVLFIGTSLTDRYFLDAIRELRKPQSNNERANTKEWFRVCSGEDCTAMRDEEDFVMKHIHYERGHEGLDDIIRRIVSLVDSGRRGVTVYSNPGK